MTIYTTLIAAALTVVAALPLAAQDTVYLQETGSPILLDGQDSRVISGKDFDGDGDMDVFVGNFAQQNIMYMNMGGGVFVEVPPFTLTMPATHTYDAAWGDMDGDGDLDLACANGDKDLSQTGGLGTNNELYKNMGEGIAPDGVPTEGRFTAITEGIVVNDLGESFAVIWLDVEGDGDMDLFFANRLQENQLYINDGTPDPLGAGMFTKHLIGELVTDDETTRDATAGDLDGDGDTDVVIANSNGLPNAIYLNLGGAQGGAPGDFHRQSGHAAVTDIGDTYGVSLGDADNDGDLDLFATNRHGQLNRLYENNGDATYVLRDDLAPSQQGGDSYASAFGDVDGDGDLDLFVANRDEINFYYVNDLGGAPDVGVTFREIDYGQVCEGTDDSRNGAFVDLDGDAFPELLVANTLGDSNVHFRNLGHQWVNLGASGQQGSTDPVLSGVGPLNAGATVVYRIAGGPANEPGTMVAGFTTVFAPFKGGTLVPSPDVVVPGFLLDGAGNMEFATLMPPGFPPGMFVYHQMWIVDGTSPSGVTSTNGLQAIVP